MRRLSSLLIAAAFWGAGCAAGLAQTGNAPDSTACAPGERLQPGAQSPTTPQNGGNLSDKLARTDGVLCPPHVDPEIKAPTPETGKMPVIPPPGSPGGDQSVRPK
jgi:hypothetical protein